MGAKGSVELTAQQQAEWERRNALDQARRGAARKMNDGATWCATNGWMAEEEIRVGDPIKIVTDRGVRTGKVVRSLDNERSSWAVEVAGTEERWSAAAVHQSAVKVAGTQDIRALCVGITYRGTAVSNLPGCINDTLTVKNEVKKRYPDAYIRVLTDVKGVNRDGEPTRAAILDEIDRLVADIDPRKNTVIIFQFAGHGTRTRDRSGDEVDNQDELLARGCDFVRGLDIAFF